MPKTITRRTFIKNTSSAAIAGALYLNSPIKLFADDKKKSKVVLIRDENLLNSSGQPKEVNLEKMMDEAIRILTDEINIKNGWQQLIKPDDVVGIKTNEWHYLRTPYELERILSNKTKQCGVKEENISIGDRRVRSNEVFQKATALINSRPMRTHDWSGVGSLIKNYITFDTNLPKYHPDSCADLAKLWYLPNIKGKTRLNILVMLTPLFHGMGPHHFSAKFTWAYNGLLVGFDPVAVDATGVRIIQAKREQFFGEHSPINPPVKHIYLADTRHHLGNADPNKIDLIKVGWEKDILI